MRGVIALIRVAGAERAGTEPTIEHVPEEDWVTL